MTLLPTTVRERGSVVVQRLLSQGVQLPEEVQGVLDGLVDRRAQDRLERARRAKVAEVVFAYYIAVLDHPLAYWTQEREMILSHLLIQTRDDPNLLLYAIDGVSRDDWSMGTHPKNSRKIESFKWLFEDGGIDRLERYAETCVGWKKQRPHPLVVKHHIPTGATE